MITIITGTPGAGKTLYTISKLLLPLVGTTVKQEENGVVVEYPRTIYTNIRGLLIDHELIDGSENGGLRNWQAWARPGAVIVFDEVQKVWEPRANGSKVPADIQALETHRHMGVDFILITQGLMLTERNLCMLCNRHLHVRRVGNMKLAIVYEWDHASRSLLFAKAFTKSPWRYDKSVFKLYKSADLHTKQPRKLPGLIWFLLAGIVAMAVLAPTFWGRMQERTSGKNPVSSAAGEAKKEPGSLFSAPDAPKPVGGNAPATPAVQQSAFAGCALMKMRCSCFGADGVSVEKDMGFCTALAHGPDNQAPNDLEGLAIPDQERRDYLLAAVEQDRHYRDWMLSTQSRAAGKPAPHAVPAQPAAQAIASSDKPAQKAN